jgi:hypothetical protein
MRLDIDRMIQAGTGVALSHLSVSGIMCINRASGDGSGPINGPALKCSRINLNLGLSAMGLTGLLLVYKSVRS